jgi:anion-transporting  ArsA/GET3 family ATPase
MTATTTAADVGAHQESRDALLRLVREQRVIICVGSGGVGKTTTAAALGLAAAAAGRKTLVITIDPARRLANALGLTGLSHTPQLVDEQLVARSASSLGLTLSITPQAPLHAMMLDLKAGWDDMLFRTAPDVATANKILANRFYRVLSTELPGAHEFIACEHLQHLASSGRFDLVVLDTPPTQNALDFLDAPSRILGVLDNDAFRFFADKSTSLGLRFLDSASGRAQSVIARFTGAEMLDELGDFLVLLKDLYEPLTQRTREFVDLLGGRHTAFLVVTAPQPTVLAEAAFFAGELVRRKLPLAAVVVNRLTPRPHAALAAIVGADLDDRLVSILGVDDGARVAAALDRAVTDEDRFASLEDAALAGAGPGLGAVPMVRLPRLSDAVHDQGRLVELLPWLVGTPARDV